MNKITPVFVEVTNCSDCPCLSRCHDEDYCNLNYEINLMWTKNQPTMSNVIYCSNECQLVNITFENKIFQPKRVLVTSTRPKYWIENEKSNN